MSKTRKGVHYGYHLHNRRLGFSYSASLFLTLYAGIILLLDSLILAVLSGIWIRTITEIHPVFCILTGIAVLAGMMLLYTRRCMFWIFTVTSSVLWGSMIGVLLHGITDGTWCVFLGMSVGIITLLFHIGVHARYDG